MRLHEVVNGGSIPACAGETLGDGADLADSGVYPRVCGGNSVRSSRDSSLGGLSPRVRGKLQPMALDSDGWRSIPACAGETCSRAR